MHMTGREEQAAIMSVRFKTISKFLAVAVPVVVAILGTGGYTSATDSPATSAEKAIGQYRSKCATCHGQDGAGTQLGRRINVRDLRSVDVQKQPDAELSQAITDGRNNMPAFKNSFTKGEIDALVAFVRGLANSK